MLWHSFLGMRIISYITSNLTTYDFSYYFRIILPYLHYYDCRDEVALCPFFSWIWRCWIKFYQLLMKLHIHIARGCFFWNTLYNRFLISVSVGSSQLRSHPWVGGNDHGNEASAWKKETTGKEGQIGEFDSKWKSGKSSLHKILLTSWNSPLPTRNGVAEARSNLCFSIMPTWCIFL